MHSDDPEISAAEIYADYLRRRVAHHCLYVDEHAPIHVDTVELTSFLFETAVMWQDGTVDVTQQYRTRDEAATGHDLEMRTIVLKLRHTDQTVIAVIDDKANPKNHLSVEELAERLAVIRDDLGHERTKPSRGQEPNDSR